MAKRSGRPYQEILKEELARIGDSVEHEAQGETCETLVETEPLLLTDEPPVVQPTRSDVLVDLSSDGVEPHSY